MARKEMGKAEKVFHEGETESIPSPLRNEGAANWHRQAAGTSFLRCVVALRAFVDDHQKARESGSAGPGGVKLHSLIPVR